MRADRIREPCLLVVETGVFRPLTLVQKLVVQLGLTAIRPFHLRGLHNLHGGFLPGYGLLGEGKSINWFSV